jgi:hypothetical protein
MAEDVLGPRGFDSICDDEPRGWLDDELVGPVVAAASPAKRRRGPQCDLCYCVFVCISAFIITGTVLNFVKQMLSSLHCNIRHW